MKLTKLLAMSIIVFATCFASCKSDSEKMINKCNTHIAALDSVHSTGDFENFANNHRESLRELVTAAKKDSIYSQQDLTEAMPHIFDAIYKHTEKQEWVLMQERPSSLASGIVTLIGIYTFRLPFCTKVSQLQTMLQNLNRVSMPLFTKYQPNQFEMAALRMGNDWVQSATIRKTEIEEGNLYDSKFLH